MNEESNEINKVNNERMFKLLDAPNLSRGANLDAIKTNKTL